MDVNSLEGLSIEQLADLKYGGQPIEVNEPELENTDDHSYNPENTDSPTGDEDNLENSQDLEQSEEPELGDEEPDNVEEQETPEESTSDWSTISKPFKANGVMMTVDSPEEAVRLMQMGLGSQKVIQEYNQSRPVIKALKDHGLFNEDTVNLLIEAKSGNLGAYKSLLSTLGFQSEQFDDLQYSEELNDFKPKNHILDEQSFTFADKLNEFDNNHPEQADYVKNYLVSLEEPESIRLVSANPEFLDTLANVKASGHMDNIIALTEKAYALGYVNDNNPRVATMSHIINQYAEKNGIDFSVKQNEVNKEPQKKVVTKKVETKTRRSASRSPQSSVPPAPKNEFDGSEESFLKLLDNEKDPIKRKEMINEYYGIDI